MTRHRIWPILAAIALATACTAAGAQSDTTDTTEPLTDAQRITEIELDLDAWEVAFFDARRQLFRTRAELRDAVGFIGGLDNDVSRAEGDIAALGIDVRSIEAEIDDIDARLEAEEAEIVDLGHIAAAEADRLTHHMIHHHGLFESSSRLVPTTEGNTFRISWRTPPGEQRQEIVTVRPVDPPAGWTFDPPEVESHHGRTNVVMDITVPADDDDIVNTYYLRFEATGWGGTAELTPIEVEVKEPR